MHTVLFLVVGIKQDILKHQMEYSNYTPDMTFKVHYILKIEASIPVPNLKKELARDHQFPFGAICHEQLYLKTGWHDLVFDKVC